MKTFGRTLMGTQLYISRNIHFTRSPIISMKTSNDSKSSRKIEFACWLMKLGKNVSTPLSSRVLEPNMYHIDMIVAVIKRQTFFKM